MVRVVERLVRAQGELNLLQSNHVDEPIVNIAVVDLEAAFESLEQKQCPSRLFRCQALLWAGGDVHIQEQERCWRHGDGA